MWQKASPSFKNVLRKYGNQLLSLLYPPECLYCKTPLETSSIFCLDCLNKCPLLSQDGRCCKCFSEIPILRGTCKPCRKLSHPFQRFGSCFDGYGPPRALVEAFLRGKQVYLAKPLASFLLLQLENLQYPPFDVIVPLPNLLFNPQFQIARELSSLLNIPCSFVLKRKMDLTPTFHLKKKCNIINQSVLLLDSITTTHTPFREAAFTLRKGWCETINGLSLCVI